MTVDQIIKYLRLNVQIQDPEDATQDPAYLSMADEDILLYLNVVLTRNFPKVLSLDTLPMEDVYPLILLSKKELYFALATKEAPQYDIGADNNNYLKRSQRFSNYMKMVAQCDAEYTDYLENGGAGANTLTSFDVLISDRYNTVRNYEKGVIPAPSLYIQGVTDTTAELSWTVKLSRFFAYKVYTSLNPIIDLYQTSKRAQIASDATLVVTIKDVHQSLCRLTGLLPSTSYHVAVAAIEMSSLTGYAEQIFTTTGGETSG